MKKTEILVGGKNFEVDLVETVFEKAWGMRNRSEGRMLFQTGGKPVVDSFLVHEVLWLYFIQDGSIVEKARLAPYNLYRPEKESDYLLESFEELQLKLGDRVEIGV